MIRRCPLHVGGTTMGMADLQCFTSSVSSVSDRTHSFSTFAAEEDYAGLSSPVTGRSPPFPRRGRCRDEIVVGAQAASTSGGSVSVVHIWPSFTGAVICWVSNSMA